MMLPPMGLRSTNWTITSGIFDEEFSDGLEESIYQDNSGVANIVISNLSMMGRCIHLHASSLFLEAFLSKELEDVEGEHHRLLSLAIDETLFTYSQPPSSILQRYSVSGSNSDCG